MKGDTEMKVRITILTLAILLVAASAAWGRSDVEKRYQFYMGTASGLMDLHINANDNDCQGGMILFRDEDWSAVDFETEFGTCQVIERKTDPKTGAWQTIWIQFTKKKDDDRVLYGWVSIEGMKTLVAGYYNIRGKDEVGPFYAIHYEVTGED